MTEVASPSAVGQAWRYLRGVLLTALAVVIIATAILVGVGRALIPYADELRPWLEQVLSHQTGQEVSLDRVEAQWPRLTPSLTLIGMHLDDQRGNRLEIDQVRLEVHLPNLIDPRANLVRLVLLGLEWVVQPDEQGRWGAELAAGAAGTGDPLRDQLPLGDLLIRDATVRIRPQGWPEILLHLDEAGVQRRGAQTQFHGILNRPDAPDEGLDLRLLIDHPEGQWSAARGWLGIEDFDFESLWSPRPEAADRDERSRLDLQLWLDWSALDDRLRLDLDFELSRTEEAVPLQAAMLVERRDRVVQFEVPEILLGAETVGAGLALARRGEVWAAAVDDLDLAKLHAALGPWTSGLPYWPQAMGGRIRELLLGMDRGLSVHAATGRIEDLLVAFDDPLPRIAGLDLDVGLEGDRLSLGPGGQPNGRWRHHLRGEVELDDISGRVLLGPDHIELRNLSIRSAVADAAADGWIYLQRPRPFLDFVIDVERVGPTDPRPYLSYRTIPPTAMAWLDDAFTLIGEASGLVVLHLRAGTQARDLHPGSYQAFVEFRGAELDYWADWPRAEALDGRVEFVGKRLSGVVERGELGWITVSATELEIADLTEPEMVMQLDAPGVDSGALAETLAAIPVPGWQAVVEPMRWSGPIDARARVVLPFRDMEDWALEGRVDLQAARLALPAIGIGFDSLSGRVEFNRSGLGPSTLQAELPDQRFDLALEADFGEPASLDLGARFNPVGLFRFEGGAAELAAGVDGASDWAYRLEGGEAGLRMRLESDLDGLALDWPAPLDKVAESVWPSSATMTLGDAGQTLQLRLGELLAGDIRIDPESWSAAIALGSAELPGLPVDGLVVDGHVGRLSLGEWLAFFEPQAPGEEPRLPETVDIRLRADELVLPALVARPAELALERTYDAWRLSTESPELAGSLTVPSPPDVGRAIVADLARVHLQRIEPEAFEEDLHGPPLDEPRHRFSPVGLPPLSLLVEDLRWGDLVLGRLRVEAHPVDAGLEVEMIDASGSDLRLQGRGRWVDTDDGPMARFLGRLATPSLSALLRSAGYEAGIEASRAQIDLDVQWPGGPADFGLSRLLGSLDLHMSDGQIPEARPGAGRLLGLASFTAIPRRLMLDFRDVFGPGMSFDEIEGRFELEGGFARTEGVVLRSTAAVITISGKTDMIARQYDQAVVVEPGLGATLPVIGGLAGGPVGAAAGLVLRQLLDRPLRGLAEVRYQVTGAWDAPEIELVGARLPEEADAPAPENPESSP